MERRKMSAQMLQLAQNISQNVKDFIEKQVMMQINDVFYENLTRSKVDAIIDELRKKG